MTWGVPEELIDQAAKELGLSAVTDAQLRDDGNLALISGGRVYTIPVPTQAEATTLPSSGSSSPASASGGSGQPHASGASTPSDAASEPPSPSPSADAVSDGGTTSLDDFTAIFGVGSVTAAKLHDNGFYTYDDLRQWANTLPDLVGDRTAGFINDWLEERLV